MFDVTERLETLHMTMDDLQEEIDKREWYHQFNFSGLQTPGYDPTPMKLDALCLPEDLSGKTVLDIGACEGFFAFECERRGAKFVMATDYWTWREEERPIKSNFMFVRHLLGSKVKHKTLMVEELTIKTIGSYDIVLFLGVVYHTKDPLNCLERLVPLTRELLIVETFVDLLNVQVPAAAFYPGASLNGDSSNYWGPNRLGMEGMLSEAGFSRTELKSFWDQNTRQKVDHDDVGARGPVTNGRMVFHVYP